MPHDHEHGHGHSHAPPGNNRVFAVGVVLNVGFVAVEVFYGLTANSLALLSDAAHNLGDVFGLLITWSAFHLGKSLPTKRRTYGLRRSSILAALTNAIVMIPMLFWASFDPWLKAINTEERSCSRRNHLLTLAGGEFANIK